MDRLSPHLGDHTPHKQRLTEAALRQQAWAEALLAREPEVGLLVMGHTHLAACATTPRGGRYLNPGAWFDGFRYAVASETDAELRRFTPTAPLPPVPADRR